MRVIGYYNSFDRQDAIYDINLEALTHLDYAFLLPASDGSVCFKDEDNYYSIERAVLQNKFCGLISRKI